MSAERKLLGRWHNGDLLPEEYMQLMKETKELLAQPEHIHDIRNMVEPVAWKDRYYGNLHHVDYGNSIPLYASPLDITGEELMKQIKTNRVFYQEGYAQAELDLKREPLSEQEIREGNQSMLNATRETFIAGVRFAEVMHGITGVDDETV